jgi:glycosyltransferase involved in cell wall biosynthesis
MMQEGVVAVNRDVVLLSTADWDNPFWTNKQHVAVGLARRGHRVLYVDSLGLRAPGVNAQDVRRMGRRVARAAAGARRVQDGIHVWSPLLLPYQNRVSVRALNRAVLSLTLTRALRSLGFERPLLWTYNPLTTRLLDLSAFDGVVYHCVDDIGAQPGMPTTLLRQAERELAERAQIVFATAPRLAEMQSRVNPNTHFLPNVADFAHFSRALDDATQVPADMASIRGPRLGFIGAISGYKVDFALVRAIAQRRPDWAIVLIGRIGEGEPGTDTTLLHGLPNLHLLGPRPYASLPAYLRGVDVAMLPSRTNDYTASMFPMKFFEYLAAGRPVVSTDLPAIRPFRDVVAIATSADSFVHAATRVLAGDAPSLESRLALAREHTWDARTDKMLALLQARESPRETVWSREYNASGTRRRARAS